MWETILEALLDALNGWLGFTVTAAVLWSAMSPEQQKQLINQASNVVRAVLGGAAQLVVDVEGELKPIIVAFANAIRGGASPIVNEVYDDFKGMAINAFNTVEKAAVSGGMSTPENAIKNAAAAFAEAAAFGASSHAVTAAFEAVFPEKLNTLNSFGPLLAKFAGFDEAIGPVREALFKNGFGTSAEYYYRSIFKPELPDETDAVLWHARQLLTDEQLKTIFNYSGLKSEYEDAFIKSAYHGISPFVMIRLLEFPVFTDAQTRDELTFSGLRPQSQENMIAAGKYLAADPFRKQTQAAYETMYEEGLLSDLQLSTNIDSTRHTNDIDQLMVLRAQVLKVVKFTKEYVTAYTDLVIGGLIDVATFQADMASLGYQPDAINARSAVIEARLAASGRKQELAAARRLEAQTTAAIRRTALENFRSGAIDIAGYTAALLATGLTPVQAAAFADLAALQKQGNTRFLYGLQVQPEAAQLLRERVAALTDQRKKLLIDDAQFLAQLSNLGIPGEVQNALLAAAAAQTTPKSQMTLVNVQT